MCVYLSVLHLVWLNWSETREHEKEIVQNKEQRLLSIVQGSCAWLFVCIYNVFIWRYLSEKESYNKETAKSLPPRFWAFLHVFGFCFVFVVFLCACHLEWLKWKGERRSCASYLSAVKNWRSRGRETKIEEKTGIQGGTTGIYKYHADTEYAWYQLRDQFDVCLDWPSPKLSKNISEVE